MNILVSGSEGYVGSTLVKRLVEELDVTVTGLDINYSQKDSHILCRRIKGDITDRQTLKHAFSRDVNVVVHLAAVANSVATDADPVRALRTNIEGTQMMLQESARHRCLFIFASSQTIYGETRRGKSKEDTPTNPLDTYSLSKHAGECMVQAYHNAGLIRGVVLRISSVYGLGAQANLEQMPGRMVADCLDKKEIALVASRNIRKPGGQIVDLVHVRDVVNAICLVIEKSDHVSGQCLNVSSGRGYPVREVAHLVAKVARQRGMTGQIVFRNVFRNAILIPRLVLSNSKSKHLLGWKPNLLLHEGIEELFEYIAASRAKGVTCN